MVAPPSLIAAVDETPGALAGPDPGTELEPRLADLTRLGLAGAVAAAARTVETKATP
jgi:hypothetical protein